jgi:CRP-like cAMP-binding protein
VVQQLRGEVLRIAAGDFMAALAESSTLVEITQRYVLTLVQQCGQNAACNAHHGARERMCRWLLASSDRIGADEFDVTQEQLAQMLGVRRQTVGVTAQLLQQAGSISYRRGRIKIHDRQTLEQGACECYWAMQEAYERLMRADGE